MDIYIVIAHKWGDCNNHSYPVTVSDNEQLARRYADLEHKERDGTYGVWVYKKTMNAQHLITDKVVYKTKAKLKKENE